MSYCNSPLRHLNYPNYLPTVGDENREYIVTIPEQTSTVSYYSLDLLLLPIYYRNVKCVVDEQKVIDKTPAKYKEGPSNYFLVNDSIFAMNVSDSLVTGKSRDVPKWVYYNWRYVTAFFIFALRHSTTFIFEGCPVPVYPMPSKCGSYINHHLLEHAHSLNVEKDIPIFFNGRGAVRAARKSVGKIIKKEFGDAHIEFLDRGNSLSSPEYVDIMSRSKISWCPRSVWSDPDRDCNTPPGKEFEAMCLESMVMKHPLGITETEERIPGVHFVEYKNNSSDLIEKLHYYLEHDDERKEIAHNGRLWWERNCVPRARAIFMIKKCLKAMGEPDSPN